MRRTVLNRKRWSLFFDEEAFLLKNLNEGRTHKKEEAN